MVFILLPLVIWAVGQTIKFIVRVSLGNDKISLSNASWIYGWGAGAPSTHAALLTVAVYLVGTYDNFGPIFGFSFVAALLFIYDDLLVERRKQLLFEEYLKTSSDPATQRVVSEGKVMDISGHSNFEIATGVLLGLVFALILGYGFPELLTQNRF